MITVAQLNEYLTQPISKICLNGYANANDNHCAHFISHVLGLKFGVTCLTMQGGTHAGANIRVQEVFARCPEVGRWADRPGHVGQCLVFVTDASNVDLVHKIMTNVPKKHVGIYVSGMIWHYSNSKSQVVSVSPDVFQHHYPGSNIAMFYGTMPLV
jgi:hypothetical protein